MYSLEGLTEGIKRCEINIQSLKRAIAAEKNTIRDYRAMIKSIRAADKAQAAAQAAVNIEVAHGDPE